MGSINLGTIDRALRILLGVVLIGVAETGVIGAGGYGGIIPLATGLLSRCPIYSLFGLSSCKR